MTTPIDGESQATLILAGFGDIAARIARQAANRYPRMLGFSRRGRRCAGLPPQLTIHAAELSSLGRWVRAGDTVLWLAPPPPDGATDPTLEAALAALPPLRSFVYLSTSGVYGDCGGAWVDERAPRAPVTARAVRRSAAEQAVEAFAAARGCAHALVRVPGIYGPGRLPVARLQEPRPVLSPARAPWSNRVHAEDLAAFLLLAAERGEGIYNISDGRPGSISEYYLAVAETLGLPPPPLVDDIAQLPPALQSYMRESRRLRIDRARALGYQPQHADFRAALPACMADDLHWSG